MLHFRLIYEQIEAAKAQMLGSSLLGYRLALILLDNVAELLMHRELQMYFALEDRFKPKWEPAYSQWIQGGLGPKYTAEERAAAEREFEPKTRILGHRLGRISADDRLVLSVCHKMRCEAFHQGRLRPGVFEIVVRVLYLTVVELTRKLSAPPITVRGRPSNEEAAFMVRFGVEDAFLLPTDKGRRQLADHLLHGLQLQVSAVAAGLSQDLLERIDEMLGGLSYLSKTGTDAEIDRNLQYTQFWREVGIDLAKAGVREPKLEEAFQEWQSGGHAKYTLHKVQRWRRQAEAIGRSASAVRALDHYWGIDRRLRPLEDDVSQAVAEYDDWIDAQIHS